MAVSNKIRDLSVYETSHPLNLKVIRRRLKRGLKLLRVAFLLFGVFILLAWVAAKALIVEKSMERADVILVLAGSSVYLERTQKAAELYKNNIAPVVLLSDDKTFAGWSQTEKRNIPFVELAQRSLVAEGVPAEAIEILPERATGTFSEAQNLRHTIEETNYNQILIVTSAYHTRRSLWTFERALADKNVTIGITYAPSGKQTPQPFFWWLSLFGWNVVAGEYIKLVGYQISY